MTIFRIYAQNGNAAGFWVQHRSWTNACARVKFINGGRSGKLTRAAEFADDNEVTWELFDVRSGRVLQVEPQPAQDRHFDQIAQPAWYRPKSEPHRASPELSARWNFFRASGMN